MNVLELVDNLDFNSHNVTRNRTPLDETITEFGDLDEGDEKPGEKINQPHYVRANIKTIDFLNKNSLRLIMN